MAMSMSSTYTGVVVSVNERGLRLDGHTAWLNFSKFAADIVPPLRGQTVSVTADSKGFLRACTVLDGPAPIRGGSDGLRPAESRSGPSGDRDRTITRLAVLKAAAEFAAARPSLKSGEVLKIAASWERWVNRSEDDLDLGEAF